MGPTSTDDNGYFSYTIGGVTPPGYFMPLAFLRRPGAGITFDRVKVISDTIKFTQIPPPEDSNIWRYRWKVDTLYSSTNIGTRYCAEHFLDGGLWPDNHQPRSGAANIFDNIIKGYEYCNHLHLRSGIRDSSFLPPAFLKNFAAHLVRIIHTQSSLNARLSPPQADRNDKQTECQILELSKIG